VNAPLTQEEKDYLLTLARHAMTTAVIGKMRMHVEDSEVPAGLRQKGASFVTLTIAGELRGCIGSLEAYQPLYQDVQQHAVEAALEDYRFQPVTEEELPLISIEISRLTAPEPLPYTSPTSLTGLLRPHQDGVILRDGARRATFLPQVWEQLPQPAMFLSHLCQKMGASPDLWRQKLLEVSIYQVEEFSEKEA
jgi:AmmeMemoRadiSam system protein A